MTKRVAVLSSEKSCVSQALAEYFKDKDVEIFETGSPLEASEYDLCLVDSYKGHISNEILNCTQFLSLHKSLLPAFDCENPQEEAFKAGVKVSGVTVYYTETKKIIAQYPVFIDVLTTFDEFSDELDKVSQKLLPFVIESVLNDIVFSFDMLLKPQNCSNDGCGGCSHGCGS